jgi:hypothetical protein
MPRFTERRYQTRVILAMLLYVVVLLLVWPLARSSTSMPPKVLLALLPALPVMYVIWQMAHRVWHSDELQQRTHLIALGASTAIVGVASLIGGFLAASGVVKLDGSILVWVFPVTLISYYVAQWWVARHYGNDLSCDGRDAGIPLRWRMLILAALMALVGWIAWRQHDAFDTGMFLGMAAAAAMVALVRGIISWRRRHAGMDGPRDDD